MRWIQKNSRRIRSLRKFWRHGEDIGWSGTDAGCRLADDYCLEVIRDEAADDEKKELENVWNAHWKMRTRTIDERDGKLYAILEDTKPMAILRYLMSRKKDDSM